MEHGIITKLKEEEEDEFLDEDDEDSDSDMDQDEEDEQEEEDADDDDDDVKSEPDAVMGEKEQVKCKWELSSDCKFLPIGHSVLPPL